MKKRQNGPITIDSGIPIPPYANGSPGRGRIYPFDDMKVGESFFVAGRHPSGIASAKSGATKRTGFTFSCRSVEGGLRVWRIK